MLQQPHRHGLEQARGLGPDDGAEAHHLDLDSILAACRRQWKVFAACVVIGLVLGYVYVSTAVPLYTAATKIILDQSNARIVDQLSATQGVQQDESFILSQVELLQSEKIAEKVVDKLDLTNNAAFFAAGTGSFGETVANVKALFDVTRYFTTPEVAEDDPSGRKTAAVWMLLENLNVYRVGRTFVLELAYTSPNPELAVKVTQAFADAYLTDQLESKYEATRRASTWLQERIEELRQRSLETDLAVQKFRTENGLVAADGRLVTDQNLSEISSQLISAQAETARTEARYERIKSIVASGDTKAIVNDALDSSVVNTLRAKYLDASKREAEISSRLGEQHVQAVRLREEMKEYERLMFEELGRFADSYRNDYQVAKAKEESLRKSVAAAMSVSSSANEGLVQLRELEREAETYRNLYQTFLQRYQEAVQQQSFPITEARVIGRAVQPTEPSRPRRMLSLALATILGAAVGAGLGGLREFRERFFRSGDQVRDQLGLEFLGLAPLVRGEDLPPIESDSAEAQHPRVLKKQNAVSNFVVDHPLSSFAETLRSAKMAAESIFGDRKAKIIGIVSALPGEGKSTVAVNFAELLAMQGSRTILIDADLRNPGLTRAVARHAKAGLLEALTEGRPVKDMLLVNPDTKLAMLPAVVRRRISHTADHLASRAMMNLLAEAEANFDYIVLDLPPLAPVVDVRAIAPRIDGFIYVVEWGQTARKMVKTTLATNPMVADKCLGVILNKVNTDKLKLYQGYGTNEYYLGRYSSYYRDDSAA